MTSRPGPTPFGSSAPRLPPESFAATTCSAASASEWRSSVARTNNSWYREEGPAHEPVAHVRVATISPVRPWRRPAHELQDSYSKSRNPAMDNERYSYIGDCTDERRRDTTLRYSLPPAVPRSGPARRGPARSVEVQAPVRTTADRVRLPMAVAAAPAPGKQPQEKVMPSRPSEWSGIIPVVASRVPQRHAIPNHCTAMMSPAPLQHGAVLRGVADPQRFVC